MRREEIVKISCTSESVSRLSLGDLNVNNLGSHKNTDLPAREM